jgi:O-antigen/teichoic acid export membrane protein
MRASLWWAPYDARGIRQPCLAALKRFLKPAHLRVAFVTVFDSPQVMLGPLFGLAGVALATPLTAVLAVLVSMLYVQDVLGDPAETPSEL